jgi:hypothetical protein
MTGTNAPLIIRIAKQADGSASFSCTRADGSTTWQRQQGKYGAFFPRHDLTHYAVETTLGYRRGFYGLVADGWDLTDFGAPWPKGPMPADMDPAEVLVGFFDAERATRAAGGAPWTAADFNEQCATFYAANRIQAPPPVLTEDQLGAIRSQLRELFARWDALPAGDTLELHFPR